VNNVSILIPSYNSAATIGDTLVSVQRQSGLSEIEAVCLADDGSTDGTVVAAESAWTEPTGLRVLRSERNSGQWPNVNRALASLRADGCEWVLVLHSDDVAKPRWLELSLREIECAQQHVASICCSWDVWRGESTVPGENEPGRGTELIAGTRTSVGNSLLVGCWWHISGCAIRLDAFEDVGLFDPRVHYAADWDWLLRCLTLGWSVAYIPLSLIRYRIHPRSVAAHSFESDLDIRESLQFMQRYGQLVTRKQRVGFHLRRLEFVSRRVARALSQRRFSRCAHALNTGLLVLHSMQRYT
jgi:glycosyltransferase involved in cell wall biosynthesis